MIADQQRAESMPTPDHLLTERLVLRPWILSDAAVQRELWLERDPRVPPHRRVDANGRPSVEDLEDRIRQDEHRPSPGLLAAVTKDSAEVIGYCGLLPYGDEADAEPELAFEFLRPSWGRGFATEASWAVVDRAQVLGYPRLWATVREWNIASRRVLTKLGFIETGQVTPDDVHGATLTTLKTF